MINTPTFRSLCWVIAAGALLTLATGCKKDEPITEETALPIITAKSIEGTTTHVLEHFGGHLGNVNPYGDREAARLQGENDNLLVVNIHAGPFAATESGIFSDDLTSAAGEYIYDHYQPFGTPVGMISRAGESDPDKVQAEAAWESVLHALQAEGTPPPANLTLTTEFDADNQRLNVYAMVSWTESSSTNYGLQYFLVESGIVSAQWDIADANPDYVHNNLLRHDFDLQTGYLLAPAIAGTTEQTSTTLQWNDSWNRGNCQVIALLRTWDANGREIFNAVAADIP